MFIDMKRKSSEEKAALRKAERIWKQAQALGFPMKASVVRRRFRCGKPGCRCAKGQKHRDMIATRYMGGKTQTIRIRSGREATALEWADNWRKLKILLAKLTAIEWQILRLPTCLPDRQADQAGPEERRRPKQRTSREDLGDDLV